jgi:hypothetical protein
LLIKQIEIEGFQPVQSTTIPRFVSRSSHTKLPPVLQERSNRISEIRDKYENEKVDYDN